MTDDEGQDRLLKSLPFLSREGLEKLMVYKAMLLEWNERINLVAESTLADIWARHFLDSAQLLKFLPQDKKYRLADLGSGAGFPGLVLSIFGSPEVHLIESIGKKANFLRAVCEKLALPVVVHQDRVESVASAGFAADVITARALKAADILFGYAKPLMKKDSLCLFLKGKSLEEELTEARKKWDFSEERHESMSDSSGSVLIVQRLEKKKGGLHAARQHNKNKHT